MKKHLNDLKESAQILAVVNDKTLKVKSNIDTQKFNYSKIETQIENTSTLKSELLDLLKNNSKMDRINEKFEELDVVVNDELNLIEVEKIEENIDSLDWDDYLKYSKQYAAKYKLDLDNPFEEMHSNFEMGVLAKEITEKYNLQDLDKDDAIVAAVAGTLAGLIDVFFIGTITDKKNSNGKLVNLTDDMFDKMVQNYAKSKKISDLKDNLKKANSAEGKEKILNEIKRIKKEGYEKNRAISFLERTFKVNYDASTKDKIKDAINFDRFNPNNHHLRSLAHDPSPLGLLIGIFDQLQNKTTLIDDLGNIVRVTTENNAPEIRRITDAITNWFGHIMSDIAGSSSSNSRGRGLPAPFTTILGKLNIGKINVTEGNKVVEKTIGQVVEKMFVSGYDLRAFTAQTIPVFTYEIIIRTYWFYKQYFYYKKEFKKSIPIANYQNHSLARMLWIGSGMFSLVDVGHAAIKYGIPPEPTNIIKFLLTVNYPGLLNLTYKSYQNIIIIYKRNKWINEEIERKLKEDIEKLF